MPKPPQDLNALTGSVLKGEYKKRGMLLETVAERSGIPYATLQKKMTGNSPVMVSELVAIAGAMIPPLDPRAAIDDIQQLWEAMSPAAVTTDALTKKRLEKEAEARAMTPDQLAEARNAATNDPELLEDEPPAP